MAVSRRLGTVTVSDPIRKRSTWSSEFTLIRAETISVQRIGRPVSKFEHILARVRQKNLIKRVRLKTNQLIEKKIFHTERIKMVSYINRCVTLAFILEQRISIMSIKCSVMLKHKSSNYLLDQLTSSTCSNTYVGNADRGILNLNFWNDFFLIYCINLVHHDNAEAAPREWR